MTVRHETIVVETKKREETIDITSRLKAAVTRAKIANGIVTVTVAHTTAAVFVNENADSDVQGDILNALERMVPRDAKYEHAEGNGPAHIKAVLVGNSVTLAIRDGSIALGTWQGVYFAELDGPRERSATITVIGD
ncbi:MAG TPA: secondary thiamine-phosphate synthase enzyme YjbQ [Candidatus Polarisedimenticolia bacterium]|nr:secondary thiamine-phosphate synthase enzyme YjbQ [Candidatus Polarisedimenticolia bacterium]